MNHEERMSDDTDSEAAHYSDRSSVSDGDADQGATKETVEQWVFDLDKDYTDIEWAREDDTGDAAFCLAASPANSALLGIYKALFVKRELSRRALYVCNEMLQQCEVRYATWSYRMDIVKGIECDWEREFDFAEATITRSIKCFHAWTYMQWLFDVCPSPRDGISLIRTVLNVDMKNFHAWSFALWYAERFHKEQDLYSLALRVISVDCRNNSAWNARRTLGRAIGVDLTKEFDDVAASLNIVGKNEAACSFMLSVAKESPELMPRVRNVAKANIEKRPENHHALRLLLAVAADREETNQICELLIKCDPLRAGYYSLIQEGKIAYE